MYDVAVVGKGLFGAAAARHLSRAGLQTAVVGPDEPAPGDERFSGPFGAHFDEARIIVARGDEPAIGLTELALDGMLALEAELARPLVVQSGGFEVLDAGSGAVELVDGVVAVRQSASRIDEPPPQGYSNPRRYVQAALDDVVAHDGDVVAVTVEELVPVAGGYRLTASPGAEVVARNVVVAAGAWSNRVLARKLALRLKREHVLFAALEERVARSIRMRPSVIHGLTGRVESIYTLPPLLYPDGRWYLKLGANTFYDRQVKQDAIDDWYRRGDSDVALDDMAVAFHKVFPTVTVQDFHTERCVISYTTHGRPYIDNLGPEGLFVATGGNGHGASWADGAGALLAKLVTDQPWPGNLPREAFKASFADENPEWPAPLLLAERM
ncbi:MAG: FAD-binding oxidoreductase [bacterium]|nr:FAD-binding oxidoreductase [bacterium]